ncbi:MAG: copper resistance protein CopC [Deltaproteobacteria bacterium]|nr:MAG: copper resistance protein CopC [Deltaproteobacteria bacterium]
MRQLQLEVYASVLALTLTAIPSQSQGHAFPIHSEPRVGWTITTPPLKVTIWFDGELEPVFSTITVYNSVKQRVDKGNSRLNAADASMLEVDLPALAPGVYRVYWKALSKDTHVIEGDFSFTIADKSQ